MWAESTDASESPPLRGGYTTGAYATACALAAAKHLFNDCPNYLSTIYLPTKPSGKLEKEISLPIHECYSLNHKTFYASAIKNAGDDPDVTHGAKIFVIVRLIPRFSSSYHVRFVSAKGVGTVTKKGLPLNIGEAAINPVPRFMIKQHLEWLARDKKYSGAFEVSVGIENGESLALKTMNGKIGILGGLSILGTSGLVRPFSCSAWVASITQSIDIAIANGMQRIFPCTGNMSERFVKNQFPQYFKDHKDLAIIEMGDLAGVVLKYVKKTNISQLSLVGGFGKISKLANGHLNLHSKASKVDFSHLAEGARSLGADRDLTQEILSANTGIEVLSICQKPKIPIATWVCQQASLKIREIIPETITLDVFVVDRNGNLLGHCLGSNN